MFMLIHALVSGGLAVVGHAPDWAGPGLAGGVPNLTRRRGAGVSKIVMLSSIAVRDEGDQVLSLGGQHKAVEDAVKAAGGDWMILRCGGFATNTLT